MQSFVEAGAWDAYWHYQSRDEFGSDGVSMMTTVPGVAIDELALGSDTRRRYVNAHSWNRVISGLNRREG